MEISAFNKSDEEWLVELNDPQAERRRGALIALRNSGALDDRLIHELRLIARGDPDAQAQFLAKEVLRLHGLKILPQPSNQPDAKSTGLLWSWEFWLGFFLCPILNFILFVGLPFIAFLTHKSTGTFQLVVNVALLIYFGFTRKNIALGMLAAFVFFIVIAPSCLATYLSWTCWPDGCGGLR